MGRLLALAGALLLVAGGFLLYAGSQVLDPDRLGERAAATLADVDLRLALAPTIAAAIGDVSPEDEPSTAEVVEVLDDPRVEDEFALASAAVARFVLGGVEGSATLDLADVTATAISVSEGTPVEALAGEVLRSARLELVGADAVLDAVDGADAVSWLCYPLLVAGLLLLAAARISGCSLAFIAVAVAAASGVGVALLIGARTLVAGRFDDPITVAAVDATWDGLFGDLLLWTAIACGLALVVAVFAGLARD